MGGGGGKVKGRAWVWGRTGMKRRVRTDDEWG